MKIKIIFSFLLIVIISGIKTYASDNGKELTESQKEILRERVIQKTEEFFSSLSKMVDNTLTQNTRSYHQSQLLNLFMGKGGPYSITNEDNEIEESTGVKMWTSSINSSVKNSMLLRNYIKRLYNPETGRSKMNYTKIKIESADAVRVDNITREGDHYVCVAYFYQDFYGIRDGRVVYKDRTCKRIKCYINPIDVPGLGKVFDAKLADITVVSTQPIY